MFVCLCACVLVCLCACVFVYLCVCIFVCLYICVERSSSGVVSSGVVVVVW